MEWRGRLWHLPIPGPDISSFIIPVVDVGKLMSGPDLRHTGQRCYQDQKDPGTHKADIQIVNRQISQCTD